MIVIAFSCPEINIVLQKNMYHKKRNLYSIKENLHGKIFHIEGSLVMQNNNISTANFFLETGLWKRILMECP